uniref:thiopurine S-methyltransferase n=1 Tax=Ningiella ruwaisensis TaxID=2364274 RepID=UPI00109F2121|nr:thiopurine S-methyltransferase [Ningiella ruwaisensis]
MDPEFWHRRWAKNEIGFHESEGSKLLKQHFSNWHLPENAKVFVPLCGKTRDIGWFLSHGIEVVAIELNRDAVDALFKELGVTPEIEYVSKDKSELIRYRVRDLTVYVGDFFALSEQDIGPVDGVYDRAALVALPEALRRKYSQHLSDITNKASQFLVCYDYDQSLLNGPPFSVFEEEVNMLYSGDFSITQLYRARVEGGFRGESEVFEAVYLLTSQNSSS